MARQLRIQFDGGFYHITSRGNLRAKIFYDNKDHEVFLAILKRTKERYGYLLHAYALMPNHFHLLIETPKANLSQIMQNINTSYTVYVNRKYRRSGHLFQGRFKGIIIDKDEYLITLSRYIHLNPVKAGFAKRPEDYMWTSCRTYIIDEGKSSLVDTADTLAYFSETKREALKCYRVFVEEGMAIEENPFDNVESGIVLGDKEFKQKVLDLLGKTKDDGELPQIKKLQKNIPIEKVVKVCSSFYCQPEKELVKKSNKIPARRFTMYLSKILSGKKNIEVAHYFAVKGATVSVAIKQIEEKLDQDKKFKKEIERLKTKIMKNEE